MRVGAGQDGRRCEAVRHRRRARANGDRRWAGEGLNCGSTGEGLSGREGLGLSGRGGKNIGMKDGTPENKSSRTFSDNFLNLFFFVETKAPPRL